MNNEGTDREYILEIVLRKKERKKGYGQKVCPSLSIIKSKTHSCVNVFVHQHLIYSFFLKLFQTQLIQSILNYIFPTLAL